MKNPGLLALALVVVSRGGALAVDAPTAVSTNATHRWPPHYGNAPEELVPYHSVTPYTKYFTTPQPFLGPGREYPPSPDLKSLKIGLLNPAPASSNGPKGVMTRRAVELAIDEANAAQRSGGLPFALIVREDLPLWGSAANIMVDFAVTDDVLAVIGTVDGDATHVALRAALKLETFIVNTSDPDPTLTETRIPWINRLFPDDRQQGYRLADLVVRDRKCRRIAVLRVNNRYGRVGVRTFVDSVRRLGTPILEEVRFRPGERDFDTAAARFHDAEPDAVVFWGEPEDVGHAVVALRQAAIKAAFFGGSWLMHPTFLETAGPAAEGFTITYPFDPNKTDRAWTEFVAKFAHRYGTPPDLFAAYAYDGAVLLIDAINKAGPNRYRIRDALAGVEEYDGVTGHIHFDPTLNNLAPLILARVEHGQFRFEANPAGSAQK